MRSPINICGLSAPLMPSDDLLDHLLVHKAVLDILALYPHRRGCAEAAFVMGWRAALALDRAARGSGTHG